MIAKIFAAPIMLLLAFCLLPSTEDAKIAKETFESGGKKRTYYLFVPNGIKQGASVPLLVTLHGSGRNGKSLVDMWKDLAGKEGFIIAGPDANNSQAWAIPDDGPDVLRDLVESLKSKHPINDRKVYLFGHSAGANFAFLMGLLESEYFAAAAVHAGAIQPQNRAYIGYAKRKIPFSIFVGDNDQFFPLVAIKETKEALSKEGIEPEVNIIKGHDHDYYGVAPKINRFVWDFLKARELTATPHYEQYKLKE